MTYDEACEAWDNGLMTLDEVVDVAMTTLTGEELEQALDDIWLSAREFAAG